MSEQTRATAEKLIEDGVFEDSNTGQAAALAAADLLESWGTYDEPYQQAHAHEYRPHDVDDLIAQLQAWKAKNYPAPIPDKTEASVEVRKVVNTSDSSGADLRGSRSLAQPLEAPCEAIRSRSTTS